MPHQLVATYRLQLHPGFRFDDARELVDYLASLGISHVYCSPVLQAQAGSMHGYDVVDPTRVNAELGGEETFARWCEMLQRHGMGLVLDVVPNHMAIGGRENPWWWDVLENGPSSRYAAYFDVDWDPPEAKLRNTILLPILGDHYGRVLDSGELVLAREGGAFVLSYNDHVLPVSPRTLRALLERAARRAGSDELAFVAEAFGRLPLATATDEESVARRHRDKEVLRRHLARLCTEDLRLAEEIDHTVADVNADADALDELLSLQNYRVAFWRTAHQELGYRRFFDINTLVSLRMEDERVLQDSHAIILGWLRNAVIDGVRIDHPDGLRDPEGYLRRLRDAAPDAWIVVEKILEPSEALPASWPVAGTTGYDFLNEVAGLFVDPAGEQAMTALYAEFTGESADFAELARDKKRLILREVLGSDVNRLAALLARICEAHRRYRDYTRLEIIEVVREMVACFAVYRTYVRAERGQITQEDTQHIHEAAEAVTTSRPDLNADLVAFVRDLLLMNVKGELERKFLMRFQQLSGPAMAKGVEDTACYCFHRLVALNEVGGDPGRFGRPVESFHRFCRTLQEHWPHTMVSTSTHDTKRSEDVRARISLLSEIPAPWAEAVKRWSARNARYRREDMPDRNMEYMLYQTLVGAWPIEMERVAAYMKKASREAKMLTSWTNPDAAYEEALESFVVAVLQDREFTGDLEAFVAPLVQAGRITSLAQTLLKMTAVGVPDIYQGTELWDLSLVDPDNRRPVDYEHRRRLLAEMDGLLPEKVMDRQDEGLPKLWAIRQALALRRRFPDAFGAGGGYLPLAARGTKSKHVVAFMRGDGVVVIVPRLVMGLAPGWAETAIMLPDGAWRNEMTGDALQGGEVRLTEITSRFPVALLTREEAR